MKFISGFALGVGIGVVGIIAVASWTLVTSRDPRNQP